MYHIYVYAYQHAITCKHRHLCACNVYTYIYAARTYCIGTNITYSTCMIYAVIYNIYDVVYSI